jgi:hypothetical protein
VLFFQFLCTFYLPAYPPFVSCFSFPLYLLSLGFLFFILPHFRCLFSLLSSFVPFSPFLSFYLLYFLRNIIWDCQVFVHETRWRIDTRDLTNYPCRAAFTLQLNVYLRSVCSERTKVTVWITVALPCRTCYQNWIYNLSVLTSGYSPLSLSDWLLEENTTIQYTATPHGRVKWSHHTQYIQHRDQCNRQIKNAAVSCYIFYFTWWWLILAETCREQF